MKFHIYKWNRERKSDDWCDYEDVFHYQGFHDLEFFMGTETSGILNGEFYGGMYNIQLNSDYLQVHGFQKGNSEHVVIRAFTEKVPGNSPYLRGL